MAIAVQWTMLALAVILIVLIGDGDD